MNSTEIQYLLGTSVLNYSAVVANGEFPKSEPVIDIIKSAKQIIACDGACNRLNSIGIVPDYVVGDNDSSNIGIGETKNPYVYIEDQYCNDLTKAIRFIKDRQIDDSSIIIFAANGQREDHAIANFALLDQFANLFSNIIMISDYGIFSIQHPGKSSLSTYINQQISFFSLSQDNLASCAELKWPLDKFVFQYLNSGTLNQATQNQIHITTKNKLIVYRSFEIK